MTSDRYIDEILCDRLKRHVRSFKGNVSPDGLFWLTMQSNAQILVVEDNAPIHNSRRTTAARASLGINRLAHPPSSPDLNPIETMWHEVKRRLACMPHATSLDQLREQILGAWGDVPIAFVNNLILGMPKHRQAVVKARGNQTSY